MGYSSTDFILSLHEAPYADEFASWLKNNFRYETEKKEMNAIRLVIASKDDLLQKYYTEASSCLERIKEISADDYLLNDSATTLLTDAEGNGYKYEFYPLTPHAFLATMCAMLSAHMILGVHDNLANVNRTRKLYSLMQRLNPASAKEFARILARYDGYRDILQTQEPRAEQTAMFFQQDDEIWKDEKVKMLVAYVESHPDAKAWEYVYFCKEDLHLNAIYGQKAINKLLSQLTHKSASTFRNHWSKKRKSNG